MGFCDIVGITSDYVQRTFGWSSTMTGFVPSMVFIWFLFLGIPVGNLMNRWGRKRTVLLGMAVTVVGMFLPLVSFSGATCIAAYVLLGMGNAVLQVSLNPLLGNLVRDGRILASLVTPVSVLKGSWTCVVPAVSWLGVVRFGPRQWSCWFPGLGLVPRPLAPWLRPTAITRATTWSNRLSFAASLSLLKSRRILLLFLGFFFVVGVDVSINYIGSKLMVARFDWPLERAKFVPQVYFLCRTAGALIGTLLLARIPALSYYRIHIVASLVPMAGLIFWTQNPTANLVCVGAVGFLVSSIFSVIYSLAFEQEPARMNEISGLMITAVAGVVFVTTVSWVALDLCVVTGFLVVFLRCRLYLVCCALAGGRGTHTASGAGRSGRSSGSVGHADRNARPHHYRCGRAAYVWRCRFSAPPKASGSRRPTRPAGSASRRAYPPRPLCPVGCSSTCSNRRRGPACCPGRAPEHPARL